MPSHDDTRPVARAKRAKPVDPEPARKRSRPPVVLIAAGVLAGLGLLSLVGLVVAMRMGGPVGQIVSAFTGPRPHVEGEEWTYNELSGFLNHKGVGSWMGEKRKGTGVYFGETEAAGDEALRLDDLGLSPMSDARVVYVVRYSSAEAARQEVGKHATDNVFAWGKFAFVGKRDAYLGRIIKVLN